MGLGGSGPSSAFKRPTSSTNEVRVPQGLLPDPCSLMKAQSLEVGSSFTDATLLVEAVGCKGKFPSLCVGDEEKTFYFIWFFFFAQRAGCFVGFGHSFKRYKAHLRHESIL